MTIREYVDALTKLASEQVGWETEVVVVKMLGDDESAVEFADGPEISRDGAGETVVELR